MKKLVIPVIVGLAVGCSGDAPTATDGLTPNFGVAGNSGCYTVDFDSHFSGLFPFFAGTATGDIEANLTTVFDGAASVFHGVVIGNKGVVTYDVTGGIIPELHGQTFRTSLSTNVLPRPDNDPFIWEITGTEQALDGVAKANLTNRGTFDLGDGTPPFDVDLVYHGVICP